MARYKPLKMKYNTQLETEIKDFLPIVGNEIPNKRLWLFDEAGVAAGFAFTQVTGTATGALNYNKAYHGNACYKVTLATTSSATVTLTPTAAVNFLQLGDTVVNNYASVKRVMKYGDEKDKAHFILNVQKSNNTETTTIQIKLYNGTKTATSSTASFTATGIEGYNKKLQWGLNATVFTFAGGFLAADFENITKIDIVFNGSGAAAVNYYIHDIFNALPQNLGTPTSVAASYYQTSTASTSLYVSHLFGKDSNTGQTKASPFKTLENAITYADATRHNIVILDSEKYKHGQEILWSTQTAYNVTTADGLIFWADYLETPEISAEAGLLSSQRCGARQYYRANFSETTNVYINQTTGNDATGARNDATKPFKTLQAGVTAAISGDVVTITDSATYNELVTVDDNMTIQAGAKCLPFLKYTGGNTALTFSGTKTVTVDGLTIQGNGATADNTVLMLSTTTLTMTNCTFTGSGSTAGGINITTDGQLNLYNSNFINNEIGSTNINRIANAAEGIFINNCKSTDNNNFYFTNDTAVSKIVYIHNSEFNSIKLLRGTYRVSIKYNKIGNMYIIPLRITTFYIMGNEFFNNLGAKEIDINTGSANSTYIIRQNKFKLSKLNSGVLTGINLDGTDAVTVTMTIDKNIFVGPGIGINIGLTTKYNTGTYNYNWFIGNNVGIQQNRLVAVYSKIATSYNVFDTCIYASLLLYDSPVLYTHVTDTTSIYYKSPINPAVSSTVRITPYDVLYSNFNDVLNENIKIMPNSLIITYSNIYALTLKAIFYEITGARTFTFLKFSGGDNCIMSKHLLNTVTNIYCSFENLNIAFLFESGIMIITNCNFTGCGTGLLQNAAPLTAHTVKYNIFKNNITGALIAGGIDFEYNTASENSYGVYNAVTGLGSLYDFALQYIIIKNNIMTKNLIYDYYGSTPTDYNMISKRSDAASLGLNDIESGSLLDGAYLYPAIIPLGYYSNDEAYGGDSTGTLNIGARYLQNVKSTLSSSDYTFASAGTGLNIWAYENPNKIKYAMTPINLSSTRTLAGDYNGVATGYAREFVLAWLEAGTEGRINPALKNALEAAYLSYWIIGISYDDAATYTYYKIKKENALQSEQVKYIFDNLPEGSATLTLIEIPLFNINDYVIIINMT